MANISGLEPVWFYPRTIEAMPAIIADPHPAGTRYRIDINLPGLRSAGDFCTVQNLPAGGSLSPSLAFVQINPLFTLYTTVPKMYLTPTVPIADNLPYTAAKGTLTRLKDGVEAYRYRTDYAKYGSSDNVALLTRRVHLYVWKDFDAATDEYVTVLPYPCPDNPYFYVDIRPEDLDIYDYRIG